MSKAKRKDLGEVFYVYALLDTRKPGKFRYSYWTFNYEPFYIGKGHKNRADSHLHPKAIKGKCFKSNKVRKILREGYEVGIKYLKTNLAESAAFMLEEDMIAHIGRGKEGPLTNLTDGGEGDAGHVCTKKQRKKMSEIQNSYSPEQRASINSKISATVKVTSLEFHDSLRKDTKRKEAWKDAIREGQSKDRLKAERKKRQDYYDANPEDYKKVNIKISESVREVHKSRSPKEKKDISGKISKANKLYNENLTDEQKKQRGRSLRASWTPERREAHSKRLRESSASRTPEYWAQRNKKRLQTMADNNSFR